MEEERREGQREGRREEDMEGRREGEQKGGIIFQGCRNQPWLTLTATGQFL